MKLRFSETCDISVTKVYQIQVDLGQINILSPITQNMTPDFRQIYTNCSEIQNGSPFMNNLCESSKK